MNEYMATFQAITQSVQQVWMDPSRSVEIKDSATQFSESLQPCFKELQQSAARLQRLTQVCLTNLAHADDVRLSKYKIFQAPKPAIWDQVAELTGASFRVRQLGQQCQREVVTKVHETWSKKATQLRNKWFCEKDKKVFKKGIHVFEKDGLLKELRSELEAFTENLIEITQSGLTLIYQERESITADTLYDCINRLDKRNQEKWQAQINSIDKQLETKFNHPQKHLQRGIRDFINFYNQEFNDLGQKSMLGMNLESFEKFCDKFFPILEEIIKDLFSDRIQVALEAIEQLIAFYNDLLEKQERYQQETPEQREAEKAWIEQQHQQIQQVRQGIEAILA